MTGSEFSTLLVIYGLGFAAVYAAVMLLYLHAWHLRDVLELNELERFDTRYQIFRLVTLVAIGLIATSLYSGFAKLERSRLHPSLSNPADVAHHSPPATAAVSRGRSNLIQTRYERETRNGVASQLQHFFH